MNRSVIVGFIALIALMAGLIYFVNINSSTHKIYTNSVHDYSFSYPKDLSVREYTDDNVVFGHRRGDFMDGIIEVRIMVIEGQPGQSFEDAIAEQFMNLCAADGPTESFSCTAVEQIQRFSTADGASGLAFYLRGELRDLETDKITVVGKGPFYVIPLATSATASKILVLHPPLNKTSAEAYAGILRAAAESVVLNK